MQTRLAAAGSRYGRTRLGAGSLEQATRERISAVSYRLRPDRELCWVASEPASCSRTKFWLPTSPRTDVSAADPAGTCDRGAQWTARHNRAGSSATGVLSDPHLVYFSLLASHDGGGLLQN